MKHPDNIGELPLIETVSHHNTTFSTSSVDVKITLRCQEIVALATELFIVRFGASGTRKAQATGLLFFVFVQFLFGRGQEKRILSRGPLGEEIQNLETFEKGEE